MHVLLRMLLWSKHENLVMSKWNYFFLYSTTIRTADKQRAYSYFFSRYFAFHPFQGDDQRAKKVAWNTRKALAWATKRLDYFWKNEDSVQMKLKDPASEYQEMQWEKLKSIARRLERHSWNRWETQTDKLRNKSKKWKICLRQPVSKGLEAEEMLPKGLWIQTGETFWEDEEKREQMDAEREYRLNPEYMI